MLSGWCWWEGNNEEMRTSEILSELLEVKIHPPHHYHTLPLGQFCNLCRKASSIASIVHFFLPFLLRITGHCFYSAFSMTHLLSNICIGWSIPVSPILQRSKLLQPLGGSSNYWPSPGLEEIGSSSWVGFPTDHLVRERTKPKPFCSTRLKYLLADKVPSANTAQSQRFHFLVYQNLSHPCF